MKKNLIIDSREEIKEFIKDWGISIPRIASKIGMPLSTFKNKLYQTQKSYFFTDEEYVFILEAVCRLENDCRKLTRKRSVKKSSNIVTSKK